MDETTILESPSSEYSAAKTNKTPRSLSNTPVNDIPKVENFKRNSLGASVAKPKRSVEDQKLRIQTRLLHNELSRQMGTYRKHIGQLKQATKILKAKPEEEKVLELIVKWRGVAQAGMSYMLNSTLLKITRLGGYEELLRREIEGQKRKLNYQIDDSMQDEMDRVLNSEDFQVLPYEVQQEHKDQMNEKVKEAQIWKEKEIARLETKMKEEAGREMTMQELSKRLKVEYDLIYPE